MPPYVEEARNHDPVPPGQSLGGLDQPCPRLPFLSLRRLDRFARQGQRVASAGENVRQARALFKDSPR